MSDGEFMRIAGLQKFMVDFQNICGYITQLNMNCGYVTTAGLSNSLKKMNI